MLDVQGAGVQAEEHDGDYQDAEHGERGAQRGERLPPRPHQLRYPEHGHEFSPQMNGLWESNILSGSHLCIPSVSDL